MRLNQTDSYFTAALQWVLHHHRLKPSKYAGKKNVLNIMKVIIQGNHRRVWRYQIPASTTGGTLEPSFRPRAESAREDSISNTVRMFAA